MTLHQTTLGIDVSKARLDAHLLPDGFARSVANDPGGIAALVAFARERRAFIVLEATARLDQPLTRALEKAGLAFHRANPKRARDFARSAGLLAKTDAVDARMLALYGRALDLRPAQPIDPERLALQGLVARRDQLVAMRKAERVRLQASADPQIAQSLEAMITVLDEQITAFDRRIDQAMAAPALKADHALIRSAPGIGPVAASVILALMPELGRVDRRAVASLAGLAPIARDSGLMRGKRHVQGGRKRVRDALYMAALAASRSGCWKQTYERLRSLGKAPKQAIIAVARKLLVALNAALRDRKPFSATVQT